MRQPSGSCEALWRRSIGATIGCARGEAGTEARTAAARSRSRFRREGALFDDRARSFSAGARSRRGRPCRRHMLGLAQIDLERLIEAEQSCRLAYAAAAALGHAGHVTLAAVCLARALFWQGRHADARSILESAAPADDGEGCARYWCLVARVRACGGLRADAGDAVRRARAGADGSPAIWSRWCGRAKRKRRLRSAISKPCASTSRLESTPLAPAHVPLQAVKLRLTWLKALIRQGRHGDAARRGAAFRCAFGRAPFRRC